MLDTSAHLPNFVPVSALGACDAEVVGCSWEDAAAHALSCPVTSGPRAITLSVHRPPAPDRRPDFYYGDERVVLLSTFPGGTALVAAPRLPAPLENFGDITWTLMFVKSHLLLLAPDEEGLLLTYTPERRFEKWLSRNSSCL